MSTSNTIYQNSIIVVGGAFIDQMLLLPSFPKSGGDQTAEDIGQTVGGCAFNVIRGLKRLEASVINAIPVGNGKWAKIIEDAFNDEKIDILLRDQKHDNGWCIALVEPSKERTFITVEGCEQFWSLELLNLIPITNDSYIYVSGYELVGIESEILRNWLLTLPESVKIYADLGPKAADICPLFMASLLEKNLIITVNRDEIALLTKIKSPQNSDIDAFSKKWNISLIVRLDKEGAWIFSPTDNPRYVAAYKVEVADTIGAGDAHCAGVLKGLSEGLNLFNAVKLGNKVAAIVVSKHGASGSPTLKELIASNYTQ